MHDPIGPSFLRCPAIAVLRARVISVATWAECAVGTILALLALGGGVTGSILMPLGPLGGLHLALDPVSALFLLVVCGTGAAAALECELPLLPVAVGALIVTLLAADGFVLVLTFGLVSIALWVPEWGGRSGLRSMAGGLLCLAAAIALLAPWNSGIDLRFAAMRSVALEGLRAAAVLLFVLIGTGLNLISPSRPGPGGALLSGGKIAVAIYILVRVLFDLCGPAAPSWWGLPLLVFGAGTMVLAGLRANAADDLLAALGASRIGAVGLIAVGLGVAMAARGSDLASLSALALAGALLHGVSYAVFDVLLVLCAGAVSRGAGSLALPQLGGLIRSMPAVGLGAFVGTACLAGLPLTAGFPGRWLVLQSFLAEPHPGRLWLNAVFALALAAVAFGSALQAAAAVRLMGIGFLGRPRTPQAAAAEDAPRQVRLVIAALAGSCMLAGLWPSAILALVQPALAQLLGLRLDGGRFLVIAAQADAPGYAALGIAAMLALAGGMVAWTLRQFKNPVASRVPAWDGGMDAAPLGLLFGASATQYSAASAGLTVLQSFGYPAWRSNTQRWLKLSIALLQHRGAAGLGGALVLVVLSLLLWAVA